jgi:hypothetical protein
MTERSKIIQKMLKMQREFIKLEQNGEFSAAEYYSDEGLGEYKKQYDELASKLVDLAHAEKGSHR